MLRPEPVETIRDLDHLAHVVVEEFIGMWKGDLCSPFTHETLRGFLVYECGYDRGIYDSRGGSKRERLKRAIATAPPEVARRIVRAILDRREQFDNPNINQDPVVERIQGWLDRQPSNVVVSAGDDVPEMVREALSQFHTLLKIHGPGAAVDRLHTAIQAYLEHMARNLGVEVPQQANCNKIMAAILQDERKRGIPRGADADILAGVARLASALDTARTKESMAHPNQALGPAEARFICEVGAALFHYAAERWARN